MRPFVDTHPGGPETRPFETEDPTHKNGPTMRLLGVLLGVLFALLHGYAWATHGAMGAMALMDQASDSWLRPWNGLWVMTAGLGWLGLLGIVHQCWRGHAEDRAGGLRALVMAGLMSCLLAPLPWLLAPNDPAVQALGSPLSIAWLVIPLPFWLGWRLRVRELEQAKLP